MKQETKNKIKATMKAKGGNQTTWKKGQKAWNYEGKGKSKRKFVRRDGKFMLNTHYVFCSYYRLKEIAKGFVIHHKDGNTLNDSIDNLVMMTDKTHKIFHNKLAKNKFIVGKELLE